LATASTPGAQEQQRGDQRSTRSLRHFEVDGWHNDHGEVRLEDLFTLPEAEPDSSTLMNGDPWTSFTLIAPVLRRDLVQTVRSGPVPGYDDLDLTTVIAQLVQQELEAFGTSGGQRLDDADSALVLRACTAALKRHGIELDFPFRNYSGFRTYWINNDMSGSWQARRSYVQDLFEPVLAALFRLADARLEAVTATAVSPRAGTGWSGVDQEIQEIIKRFRAAVTPQDYRAVGGNAVGVLEALGMAVHDPAKHLSPGDDPLPRDKTKERLDRYIQHTLPGGDNEALRGLCRKAIEFAQKVKHRPTPTRTEAGVAADAVIMLANILRRIADEL